MTPEKIIQLRPGEEIFTVVHEHFIPHFPKILLFFLWLVIPFFFLFPLWREGILGIIIFFALIGSASIYAFRFFFKWSHTVLIITDQRVIDIEQKSFFDRIVTEIPIHSIDEAAYRIKGFIPTIFTFGTVRLKTTGSSADIKFSRIHKPAKIQALINDLRIVNKETITEHAEIT